VTVVNRGRALILLAIALLCARPLSMLLFKAGDRLAGGFWSAVVLVVIVVLVRLRWTGTPHFRWVAAAVLFLVSSRAAYELQTAPRTYESWFLGLYALAGLFSAILLLESPRAGKHRASAG